MAMVIVLLVVIAVLAVALAWAPRVADARQFCPRAETLVAVRADGCRAADGRVVGNPWNCERACLHASEARIRRATGYPVVLR